MLSFFCILLQNYLETVPLSFTYSLALQIYIFIVQNGSNLPETGILHMDGSLASQRSTSLQTHIFWGLSLPVTSQMAYLLSSCSYILHENGSQWLFPMCLTIFQELREFKRYIVKSSKPVINLFCIILASIIETHFPNMGSKLNSKSDAFQ